MNITSLYRKYRPNNFNDVKGQEHIVKALTNQLRNNRLSHAYLLCGTRGTGKTTIAKILAKAANCSHLDEKGNPCNECELCKEIDNGASMNVVEIDAASNNGVDNIRQIKDEITYRPTEGKYKVYIIDEVHMLSSGAFNALLKTLEEPPEYVIFILATTEPQKIPITILSRCQRYDFHHITIDEIAERINELLKAENVESEPLAVKYIAKKGDGSMRDALSLLERCIAIYMGEKLTYNKVLEILGGIDFEVYFRLLESIIVSNVPGCMKVLESIVMEGKNLSQFVEDFLLYLRNLLMAKTINEISALEVITEMSREAITQLKEQSEKISEETIIRYIRVLSALHLEIKSSTYIRVSIEVALIKLCKPEMEANNDGLIQRIENLEQKLENGNFKVIDSSVNEKIESENNKEIKKNPKAAPKDLQNVIKSWDRLISDFEAPKKIALSKMVLSFDENDKEPIIYAHNCNSTFCRALMYNENGENISDEMSKIVSENISQKLEKNVIIKFLDDNEVALKGDNLTKIVADDGLSQFHINIETSDEQPEE